MLWNNCDDKFGVIHVGSMFCKWRNNTTQSVFSFPCKCNKVVYIQCQVHYMYVNTLYKCFIANLLWHCGFFFTFFKKEMFFWGFFVKKKLISSYYLFCMFFGVFCLINCSIFSFNIFGVFELSHLTSKVIHDLYM